MTWQKPSEDLIAAFHAALPQDGAIVRRKMFGMPAAFVRGNMFAGVHQNDVVVRLPEQARSDAMTTAGARPFEPMPGRPMKEYVVLPATLIDDAESLSRWVDEAFRFAAALPVKEPKPRRKKTA